MMYIHVGLPKTATTTLQKTIFRNHSDIINYNDIHEDAKTIVDNIIFEDSIFINSEDLRLKHLELLSRIKAIDKRKKIILSRETLTHKSNLPKTGVNDLGLVVTRLKDIFVEGKIIITIREQKDILGSYFNSGLTQGNDKKTIFKSINKFVEYSFSTTSKDDFLGSLHYYNIIKFYEQAFGKENLLLLCYEELLSNKICYIEKICTFMSINCDEALLLIGNNYHNKATDKNGFFRKAKKSVMNSKTKKSLMDLYMDGNKKLDDEYGLTLQKYGYY